GERKLAYPIDKKKTGFYVLTTLEMDGTKLTEVESKLNITEEVMRYMVVKND
ncbi:MAG: 30S ribosomal protein S6, partial [Cetobacterium sp.]